MKALRRIDEIIHMWRFRRCRPSEVADSQADWCSGAVVLAGFSTCVPRNIVINKLNCNYWQLNTAINKKSQIKPEIRPLFSCFVCQHKWFSLEMRHPGHIYSKILFNQISTTTDKFVCRLPRVCNRRFAALEIYHRNSANIICSNHSRLTTILRAKNYST